MQIWRRTGIAIAVAAAFVMLCAADEPPGKTLLLWPDGTPNAAGNEPEDQPKLTVFLPQDGRPNGTGVVIYPGGGYKLPMGSYDGNRIGQWLSGLGITAFVLEYRLAPRYRHPAQIEDAERAIRYVRYHHADYQLAEDRIGALGFSAGGHLVALVATGFPLAPRHTTDAIDRVSARPDFVMLGYPVISMFPPYAHDASVENLLGPSPTEADRRMLSAEQRVTPDTPPAFIVVADEDKLVSPLNSVLFYEALRKADVSAELHVFAHGQHGFGLADGLGGAPDITAVAAWKVLARNWMSVLGFLDEPAGSPP